MTRLKQVQQTPVLSQPGNLFPLNVSTAVIEVKQLWEDDWSIRPDLELLSGSVNAAGSEIGQLVFQRRYGDVKDPFAPDYDPSTQRIDRIELGLWWVRMTLSGDQGDHIQWVGQISNVVTDVYSSKDKKTGIQKWVAYDPMQRLGKIHVSKSIWQEQIDNPTDPNAAPLTEERTLGWIPDMNGRDEQNVLVGNRSETLSSNDSGIRNTYTYGGTKLWTRKQYLEYVLARFVDERAYNGPRWQLGGQVDLLANISDIVIMGTTQSVAQIIRRLIPIKMGLDFKIVPIESSDSPGFEIRVFALTGTEQTFGGSTLLKNPNLFNFNTTDFSPAARTVITESLDQQYDRINVIGERIVVCTTLRAGRPVVVPSAPPTLVPKWSDTLQTKYAAGTGNPDDEEEAHKKYRGTDQFIDVFQAYGAPEDWNPASQHAAPSIDAEGQLAPNNTADHQTKVRSTLRYLPLMKGIDYFPATPVDHNVGENHEEMEPLVFLYDPEDSKYVQAEGAGVEIAALSNDWGVRLKPNENHVLALNHWPEPLPEGEAGPPEPPPTPAASETDPAYDHEKIVATIAFRTDQRLALRFELTSGESPIGSELNIHVPGAELFYLTPNTVVGVNENGQLLTRSTGLVLRNDADQLALVMAGAIARYNMQRVRAVITIKGLWPYADMVGQILHMVEGLDGSQIINAPITSVDWSSGGDDPTTILRTGYA